MIRVNLDNLPAQLKEHGLFCVWKFETRQGSDKPAKVPYNPKNNARANSADRNTFGTFADVQNFAEGGYNGVGVGVFGNLAAIDIDHCIADDGTMSDMASDIMNIMRGAYTEVSPSGRGLRILCLIGPNFRFDKSRYYINNQALGLEIYIAGYTSKYVSTTGNTMTPGADLEDRSAELMTVLEKYMLRRQQTAPINVSPTGRLVSMEDTALVEKAKNAKNGAVFAALMAGDTSAYDGDDSRADMALCNMLAFWTGKNADQMDRIFRTSGLMRDKWDRPTSGSTYGRLTIENAISSQQQVYLGGAAAPAANAQQPNMQQISVISAIDLQKAALPDVRYWVEDILPEGTNILSAASKVGKSWMVLDMGLRIAAGEPFWGHPTQQCGVLYLALEDSLKRLQNRMNKILKGKPAPPQFYFATEAPTLDTGLLDRLDKYIDQYPDVKLIIIDTFQKIRGQAKGRESVYAQDYREMSILKTYMARKGVSVLLVHHNRKMEDTDDPYNMISGSNGIMGAADTIWVITKTKRANSGATLHITGRDVTQCDLDITFDKTDCTWKILDAEEQARQSYDDDPTVKTIKELLEQSQNGRWDGTATDLLKAGTAKGRTLALSPQRMGYVISDLVDMLFLYDGISHGTSSTNGSGGKLHHFYLQQTQEVEVDASNETEDQPF